MILSTDKEQYNVRENAGEVQIILTRSPIPLAVNGGNVENLVTVGKLPYYFFFYRPTCQIILLLQQPKMELDKVKQNNFD